jgi:hypothetical protein
MSMAKNQGNNQNLSMMCTTEYFISEEARHAFEEGEDYFVGSQPSKYYFVSNCFASINMSNNKK